MRNNRYLLSQEVVAMVAIDSSAFGSGARASGGTHARPSDAATHPAIVIGRHRGTQRAVLTWRRMMYAARHRKG